MNEKIGIFEGFIKAFYSFKDYPRYRKQGGFKVFLYILLLTLILAVPTLVWGIGFKAAADAIKEEAKWQFNSDRTLSIDRRLISDDSFGFGEEYPQYTGKTFVAVDTDVDFIVDFDSSYIYVVDIENQKVINGVEISEYTDSIVAVGKTGLSIYNDGELNEILYEDIEEEMIQMLSYENVMKFIDMLWILAVVCVILFKLAAVLFGAFVQTIIALIQNNGKGKNSFSDLFKMSVYARTIPAVIVFAAGITGISIPFLWLINYIIGAVFTSKAIKETIKIDVPESVLDLNGGDSYGGADFNSTNKDDFSTPFNNYGSYTDIHGSNENSSANQNNDENKF